MTVLTKVIPEIRLVEKRRLMLVKGGKHKFIVSDFEILQKFEKEIKEKILELEEQKRGVGLKIVLDKDTTIQFMVRKYPISELRDLCYTFTTFKNGRFFKEFLTCAKLRHVKLLLNFVKKQQASKKD